MSLLGGHAKDNRSEILRQRRLLLELRQRALEMRLKKDFSIKHII
jgi:hypothetical protein